MLSLRASSPGAPLRHKGNDVITNVISANQHFASTFSMQIFKLQRRSCKLSILFPPRRKSAPEILLAGYTVLLIYNGRFVVSTYRSSIRPIDGDLRSRPFWIINDGNIDWSFLSLYYIVCGHWDQITSISTKKRKNKEPEALPIYTNHPGGNLVHKEGYNASNSQKPHNWSTG